MPSEAPMSIAKTRRYIRESAVNGLNAFLLQAVGPYYGLYEFKIGGTKVAPVPERDFFALAAEGLKQAVRSDDLKVNEPGINQGILYRATSHLSPNVKSGAVLNGANKDDAALHSNHKPEYIAYSHFITCLGILYQRGVISLDALSLGLARSEKVIGWDIRDPNIAFRQTRWYGQMDVEGVLHEMSKLDKTTLKLTKDPNKLEGEELMSALHFYAVAVMASQPLQGV